MQASEKFSPYGRSFINRQRFKTPIWHLPSLFFANEREFSDTVKLNKPEFPDFPHATPGRSDGNDGINPDALSSIIRRA